jgi:hypothetical protein
LLSSRRPAAELGRYPVQPCNDGKTPPKKEFVPDYLSTITNWLAPRVRSTP